MLNWQEVLWESSWQIYYPGELGTVQILWPACMSCVPGCSTHVNLCSASTYRWLFTVVSVNHLPSPLRQVHYLGSGDPKLTEGLVYTLRLKLRCKYHKGLISFFKDLWLSQRMENSIDISLYFVTLLEVSSNVYKTKFLKFSVNVWFHQKEAKKLRKWF